MNILAPPKARLGIEIVHDLVCPWCFLGVRRLMRTLRRRPDLLFDLTWRPFLLNPDMPRAGMARPDYVIRKFGGEDRARRLYASITEIGRTEGIQFRFDRIRRTPSSVDAHRLVRYAARFGQGDAIVEALFSAHFTDGLDIGDHALLVAIASACGLDGAAARRFLAGSDQTDAIHADNLRAHRLGINGVPCFIVNRKYAVSGAQPPSAFVEVFNLAERDAATSTAQSTA